MTHIANHLAPKQGKFRRALATAWGFLEAMESSSIDHTLNRIERLEREVGRLKEDLRKSRDSRPVDARNGNVVALE